MIEVNWTDWEKEMDTDEKPFGDTLIAGAFNRLNKVTATDDNGQPVYGVTFDHSDGETSFLMMCSDETPCDVFLAGAFFMHKKINRWVEKGDIKLA